MPIPPSYVEYATNPKVRTAVDHILSKCNPEPPSCLAWTELPAYYRAVLSAHQVRCEFDELMHSLWEKIWRPAWNQNDFGENRAELNLVEAQKWHGQSLAPNTVWQEGWLGGTFTVQSAGAVYEVGVGIRIDFHSRIQLSLDVYGPEDGITRDLLPDSPSWPEEYFDGNCAWTPEDLLTIDKTEVEIAPLQEAAAQAIDSIRVYLQP